MNAHCCVSLFFSFCAGDDQLYLPGAALFNVSSDIALPCTASVMIRMAVTVGILLINYLFWVLISKFPTFSFVTHLDGCFQYANAQTVCKFTENDTLVFRYNAQNNIQCRKNSKSDVYMKNSVLRWKINTLDAIIFLLVRTLRGLRPK